MQKFYDYKVTFVETTTHVVRVIAKNDIEAQERACEAYRDGRFDKKESKIEEDTLRNYEVSKIFFEDITSRKHDYSNHLPISFEQARIVWEFAEVIKIHEDGSDAVIESRSDLEKGYEYAIERSKFPELMDLLLEGVMK